MPTWTVRAVLEAAEELAKNKRSRTSRADLTRCLAAVLGLDRLQVLLQHERPLDDRERAAFREMLKALLRGVPIAYVLGEQDFYGRAFSVDPAVLIPRPETEGLVEHAIALLPKGARVFEPCTGSGCIAISLLLERDDLFVLASDISREALRVARKNAARYELSEDRLRLAHGRYWEAAGNESFDALIANPPYVDPNEQGLLDPQVGEHEPGLALFASRGDRLDDYRELLAGGRAGLKSNALVLLELGIDSSDDVLALFRKSEAYTEVLVLNDLSGKPRILCCRHES